MKKIDTYPELEQILSKHTIRNIAFQSLNLTGFEKLLADKNFIKCLFLDCEMTENMRLHIYTENYIFPRLDVPYSVYPPELYNKNLLYGGYDYRTPESYKQTYDKTVYDYYRKMGVETRNIKETLARSLHDHSINDALNAFLEHYEERKIVAIMGGHKLGRDDVMFLQIALLSKQLAEQGFLMVSGGGPGAMEATHLGAWFAGKYNDELAEALKILAKAPHYDHPEWIATAFQVLEKYPETKFKSLGIPTWLYGHELSTPFATHIAKFFENSIREEGLLAIAKGGVVFSPGSAGTMQEIFQDLAQNHYESYGYASPMVFLDSKYWTEERPVFPLIKTMVERGDLHHIDLQIYDSNDDIITYLTHFSTKQP
ncbi:MAG: LOG family protein [Paludibacteraceae bacterium]